MKKKFRILSKSEEMERASDTLTRGICFITKVPLNDKPYELIWHAGAESFVFVDRQLINKETTDV